MDHVTDRCFPFNVHWNIPEIDENVTVLWLCIRKDGVEMVFKFLLVYEIYGQ